MSNVIRAYGGYQCRGCRRFTDWVSEVDGRCETCESEEVEPELEHVTPPPSIVPEPVIGQSWLD